MGRRTPQARLSLVACLWCGVWSTHTRRLAGTSGLLVRDGTESDRQTLGDLECIVLNCEAVLLYVVGKEYLVSTAVAVGMMVMVMLIMVAE